VRHCRLKYVASADDITVIMLLMCHGGNMRTCLSH